MRVKPEKLDYISITLTKQKEIFATKYFLNTALAG